MNRSLIAVTSKLPNERKREAFAVMNREGVLCRTNLRRLSSLPPELGPPDATIPQVATFTNSSPRTVQRKIEDGTYESYKDGDRRLITWKSVLEDRERCRKLGPQLSQRPATGKRPVGRPRKRDAASADGRPGSRAENLRTRAGAHEPHRRSK